MGYMFYFLKMAQTARDHLTKMAEAEKSRVPVVLDGDDEVPARFVFRSLASLQAEKLRNIEIVAGAKATGFMDALEKWRKGTGDPEKK